MLPGCRPAHHAATAAAGSLRRWRPPRSPPAIVRRTVAGVGPGRSRRSPSRAVAPGAAQARRGEQLEQGRVPCRPRRGSARSPWSRVLRQALEQQGVTPWPGGTGDDEAGLGSQRPRIGTVRAREPSQLVRHQRHRGHPDVVVDPAEASSPREAEIRAGEQHVLVRAGGRGPRSPISACVSPAGSADDDRLPVPEHRQFSCLRISSRHRRVVPNTIAVAMATSFSV